jgi:hypothetical protein
MPVHILFVSSVNFVASPTPAPNARQLLATKMHKGYKKDSVQGLLPVTCDTQSIPNDLDHVAWSSMQLFANGNVRVDRRRGEGFFS